MFVTWLQDGAISPASGIDPPCSGTMALDTRVGARYVVALLYGGVQ